MQYTAVCIEVRSLAEVQYVATAHAVRSSISSISVIFALKKLFHKAGV